ncbi:MAG: hypothetical protein JSW41_03040 [Candidatus Aenigmatarchaeota archaeon]|nr:MAG: hypothetical protein JSW41_03040 [Candidatus Aenigmarchaeota archaeon]
MTKVIMIYKNLWRKGTVIGKSSQNHQFPAEDTQQEDRDFFWRSLTDTETAYIANQLGATAQQYNFAAILNHNIPSGATTKIIGADDSSFTTGVVEDTLDWNAGHIFDFLSTARTKKFVKTQVTNGNNPDDYIQEGPIWVAKYFMPNESFVIPYRRGFRTFSEKAFSDSLNEYVNEKPRPETGLLSFKNLSDTSRNEVMALLEICGTDWPFIIVFDYNNPNSDSILVKLEEENEPEYHSPDNWSWDCPYIEVP